MTRRKAVAWVVLAVSSMVLGAVITMLVLVANGSWT